MTEDTYRLRKAGRGWTKVLRDIIGSGADLRIPDLHIVQVDGRTVGVIGIGQPSTDPTVQAFHVLPEFRDVVAADLREWIRKRAKDSNGLVTVRLKNEDPWAEAFLESIVSKPESDPKSSLPGPDAPPWHPPLPEPPVWNFWTVWMNLAGLAAILGTSSWFRGVSFRDAIHLGGTGFVTVLSIPLFLAAVVEPFGLGHRGACRFRLRRRLWRASWAPILGGMAGVLPVVWGVPAGLSIPIGFGAGCYCLVWAILRRPGAHERGIALPDRFAFVPWDNLRRWRRMGCRFELEFHRWQLGLHDDRNLGLRNAARFDVEDGDAFEVILREMLPAVGE